MWEHGSTAAEGAAPRAAGATAAEDTAPEGPGAARCRPLAHAEVDPLRVAGWLPASRQHRQTRWYVLVT